MKPADERHRAKNRQQDLFRPKLVDMLDEGHPLMELAEKLRWQKFETEFGALFRSKKGRPAIPTRIIVGLLYLKHTFNLSDEDVVLRFGENPYWQYFCGFSHFEHSKPCEASVLVRWRKRLGERGLESILQETLAVAFDEGYLKPQELADVVVDTTVQEKNIMFPTDAKLLNRARESLIKEAKSRNLILRQTYAREGREQLIQYQRYCHAKQFKRARKPLKRLRTILGRVIREMNRLIPEPEERLRQKMIIATRIFAQKKKDSDKVYSVHEPKVECISKGKAHKRYEFGCKVSIAITNRNCWVVGVKACHGRPYDGHTLPGALQQARRIIGRLPKRVYADRGYRGKQNKGLHSEVFITGQKRGLTPKLKKLLKRRSAVEPVIGHLKSGHRLGRNFLKGIDGDQHNAILAGIGFNMAKLLAAICLFFEMNEIWIA